MIDCKFDPKYRNEVLDWLIKYVQPNYHDSGAKYNSSTISRFIEWRSKDLETWIMRVYGVPVQGSVKLKDSKSATLFLLRWQ